MRAEKVIKQLLANAAGVSALVAARLYAVTRPENDGLPAVVWSSISDVPQYTISASSGPELMESRIQVNCLAVTVGSLKDVVEQVRIACNLQSGVINGVTVVSVIQSSTGPDSYDQQTNIYYQSIDFMVLYYR